MSNDFQQFLTFSQELFSIGRWLELRDRGQTISLWHGMNMYKNIKQVIKITREYVQIKTCFTPTGIENPI